MNQNKILMVILSCAIGAGIGVLFAAQFGIYWWLGVLLGGVAGYMIYDFKAIAKAIPIALSYVANDSFWKAFLRKIVAPIKVMIGKFCMGLLIYSGLAWSIYLVWISHSYLLPYGETISNIIGGTGAVLGTMGMFSSISFFLSWKYRKSEEEFNKYVEDDNIFIDLGMLPLLHKTRNNLFLMVISCLLSPVVSAPFLLIGVAKLTKLAVVFSWKLFKLVHSDIRLLVLIDSIVGGTTGHIYHNNILIGMLVGGISGLISYKLISIRIFKLKPKH